VIHSSVRALLLDLDETLLDAEHDLGPMEDRSAQ
jgi:hypothetical protein